MNIYVLDYDPIESAHKLVRKDKDRAIKQVVDFLQLSAMLSEHLELNPIKDINGNDYNTESSPDMPIELISWITFNGKFNNDLRYFWCLIMCKRISEELDIEVFHENYFSLYRIKEEMYKKRGERMVFKDCHEYREESFINYAKNRENDYTHIKDIREAYNLLLDNQSE